MKLELMIGPNGEMSHGLSISVPESADLWFVTSKYFEEEADPRRSVPSDLAVQTLANYVIHQALTQRVAESPMLIPANVTSPYMRRLADITGYVGGTLTEFGRSAGVEALSDREEEGAAVQAYAVAYDPGVVPIDARALEAVPDGLHAGLVDQQRRIDLLATEFSRFWIDSFEYKDNL